jgi:hypothetical protein
MADAFSSTQRKDAAMKRFLCGLMALALLGFGITAMPAQAVYTVTLTEVRSDVVATGSGTLDVTDLGKIVSCPTFAQVNPYSVAQHFPTFLVWTYTAKSQGPRVSGAAASPPQVREAETRSVSLVT